MKILRRRWRERAEADCRVHVWTEEGLTLERKKLCLGDGGVIAKGCAPPNVTSPLFVLWCEGEEQLSGRTVGRLEFGGRYDFAESSAGHD